MNQENRIQLRDLDLIQQLVGICHQHMNTLQQNQNDREAIVSQNNFFTRTLNESVRIFWREFYLGEIATSKNIPFENLGHNMYIKVKFGYFSMLGSFFHPPFVLMQTWTEQDNSEQISASKSQRKTQWLLFYRFFTVFLVILDIDRKNFIKSVVKKSHILRCKFLAFMKTFYWNICNLTPLKESSNSLFTF